MTRPPLAQRWRRDDGAAVDDAHRIFDAASLFS
jgi:hypothetical protein